MSEDETIAIFVALGVIGFWGCSRVPVLIRLSGFTRDGRILTGIVAVAVGCIGFLYWLLSEWAAHDVVSSVFYRSYYLVLGLAWIVVALLILPWMGLSFRDDVLERKNHAAGLAIGGAVAGTAVIYGLANTGDGPGWWCVIVAAFLGQAVLFAGWAILLLLTELYEEITVDRDLGAGLRAGAWFFAAGLVLGRGAAGTWTSLGATVSEFIEVARYFPLLLIVGILTEVTVRSMHRGQPDPHPILSGAVGAALHIGTAAFILNHVGPWS